MTHSIKFENFSIGKDYPLTLIAGPCVIESQENMKRIAETIKEITDSLNIPFIFKASYDKANRTNIGGYRGPGILKGLEELGTLKKELGVKVTSDVHSVEEAKLAGDILDLIQIPAGLCKQLDLILAAGKTKKPVNLKKGHFVAPWEMKNLIANLEKEGCDNVMITERGTFFGYNMLVNDMTSFPIMAQTGNPVCFDATHSVQLPTSMGNISGGQREFIPYLVRAAVACGVNALFMEVHNDPDNAKSDSNTVLDIKYLENIIFQARNIHEKKIQILEEIGEDNVE